jgi:hypothetical protein
MNRSVCPFPHAPRLLHRQLSRPTVCGCCHTGSSNSRRRHTRTRSTRRHRAAALCTPATTSHHSPQTPCRDSCLATLAVADRPSHRHTTTAPPAHTHTAEDRQGAGSSRLRKSSSLTSCTLYHSVCTHTRNRAPYTLTGPPRVAVQTAHAPAAAVGRPAHTLRGPATSPAVQCRGTQTQRLRGAAHSTAMKRCTYEMHKLMMREGRAMHSAWQWQERSSTAHT